MAEMTPGTWYLASDEKWYCWPDPQAYDAPPAETLATSIGSAEAVWPVGTVNILPSWDDGSGPTRNAAPARRSALTAAAVIVVLALGVGYILAQTYSAEPSTDAVDVVTSHEVVPADPRVAPVDVAPLTPEQIAAGLLTPADVPPAFSVVSDETPRIEATNCPDKDRVEREVAGTTVIGEISFNAPASFGEIQQRIAVHPGRAAAIHAELRRAYDACPVLVYAGSDIKVRVSPLPVPTIGDATVAHRLDMVMFFGPITIETVTFRLGDTLVTTSYGALRDGFRPGLATAMARRALDRIRRVTNA